MEANKLCPPSGFREIQVTLTVRVPAADTVTALQVGEAIDGALDEPGNCGNDWGEWEVGGVTTTELLDGEPDHPAEQ